MSEALAKPASLLLTVEEVAEILRCSEKAVYDRSRRGKLPGALHDGRRLLVRRAELLRSLGLTGRGSSGECT